MDAGTEVEDMKLFHAVDSRGAVRNLQKLDAKHSHARQGHEEGVFRVGGRSRSAGQAVRCTD